MQITYPGSGNISQFTYDELGRCVKLIEVTAGSTTGTRQFIWGGTQRCEERDGSDALTKQFLSLGQKNGSASYPYALNNLGTVTEMTNASAAIQAQYGYDAFGKQTKLQGSGDADFGFAGMFNHSRSGLNLTVFRAYEPSLGRWLSHDPVESSSVYSYVTNDPVNKFDSVGLCEESGPNNLAKRMKGAYREFMNPEMSRMLEAELPFLLALLSMGISVPASATAAGGAAAEAGTAAGIAEAGATSTQAAKTLYHYTNEAGMQGIVESGELWPSLKSVSHKDARYGNGQYLSDIVPGTKSPSQLSKEFLNLPWQGQKFTHFVEIDVQGLPVIEGRPGVFVIPNESSLSLTGRIMRYGKL